MRANIAVKISPLLFLFASLLPDPANALRVQSFSFEYTTEGIKKEIVMHIEYQSSKTEIMYYNEFGDKDITVYQSNTRTVYATYYNPERDLFQTSYYDYARNKIKLTGMTEVTYDLQQPVFENNGSTFYIFSVYYPQPGASLKFKMLQSNLIRINDPFLRMLISRLVGPVDMQLKYVTRENVTLDGNEYLADKYELGIQEGNLSVFWPYKYYFWYRSSDRVLLKHTGFSAEKKPNQYILMDFNEWERPDPELPSL